MLQILLDGVSTRRDQRVIPEMADTVGVSRSTVSRETIEASETALQQLLERRFDDVEPLILYIGGMRFGDQCVRAAVGVDIQGCKHVLALREGATENAEAAKDLLQHLVEHGVDPTRRRSFIIDGSKALRTAINAVFGTHTPVQRCRNHKLRNVLGRLPREQQAQTGSLMRAAWKMNQKDGMAKFRQIAGWLENQSRGSGGAVGRIRGMLHHQSTRHSALAASLSGYQQHRGQSPFRSSRSHAPGLPLASGHAGALVGSRFLGNRQVVPQDHGLSRSRGPQGDSRWIAASYPAGGSVK